MAMVVMAVVCGTMAAPQEDRRKIKVSASFSGQSDPDSSGKSRALSQFEEPLIITEPLPGQEFVFISANPRQSQAAGGRTARVNPIPAQLPSVRIESSGSGTILEDGILIAEHLGESNRAARLLDEPSAEPTFPVEEADTRSWTPLSLPELLTGPAIVREQEPVSSIQSNVSPKTEEARSLSAVPVAEQFSFQDAVDVAPQSGNTEQVANPAVVEESARQSKAVEGVSQDDDNLIAAESVSRRTVIKTAPNGQDYEYEYLYYDGIDVDEANATTSAVSLQEPTLFSNDQENVNASPIETNAADNKLSSGVQLPFSVEEELSVTTESDLVEVQEIPHVAQVAFQVGDITDNVNVESFDAVTTEDVIAVTEEATTTTTTTTTPAPTTTTTATTVASRRRRPTAIASTEVTMRPSLTRLTPLRRGNTPAVTEEPIITTTESKRIRGKNRFSSDSIRGTSALNQVATESKTEGSDGIRRPLRPRIRPSTSSTLENRAGLAEVRFEDLEGEIADANAADIANDDSLGAILDHDGLDFSRQSQAVDQFPINGRNPEHLQEEQEAGDFFVQERTPLRVVESDSFRNTGSQGSAGEQPVSVGRLTVISGPARLPTPLVVEQFEDIAEQEEIVRPTVAPVKDLVESTPQIAAGFEADIPAAEPEHFVDEIHNQEFVEVDKHTDDASPFSLNHPSLSDLLAFSKAAEQQQQDDQPIQIVPAVDFEEVLIEEVLPTTIAPIIPSVAAAAPQVHSSDDQLVTQLVEDLETPAVQQVQTDVADFVEDVVTTPESVALSIEPVQTEVDPVVGLTFANDVEIPQTTDSVLEAVEIPNAVSDNIVETSTAATTTTTTTTTTTVATTTTQEPTTTEAPSSSVRAPSRFGSNANRFNNRIRNRVRGGSDDTPAIASTTTTTTTTAAPVKKNTFRPAGSPFNRLRRPTTPPTDTLKSTSSETIDAAVEITDTSSPASVVPSTTRKPLSNNFRNRFQFRRNQTEAAKPAESSATSEEPKVALPTVRPKPSGTSQLQSNRIAPPRPMSSILKRGRFTTTTTTEAAPVVASVDETSTNETVSETERTSETQEKPEGEVVETADPEVVSEKVAVTVATEPTTTTTTRSAGLNRLRNRVSLPVSERPKTVRTQVSLSDRRNRFSVLSTKKAETEAETSETNEEKKEETQKAVANDVQEEEVTGNNGQVVAAVSEGSADSSPGSESGVEAVASATEAPVFSIRNRRPNRIPGQLAARRT